MREAILRTLQALEAKRTERSELIAPSGTRDRDRMMLAVGPDTGQFLNSLIRATRATRVLEVGGSMGYSTLWQAEALEQSGGRLITLEAFPAKAEALRKHVAEADLERTVQVIEGDAREVIPTLPGPFDFVLIDAWKADYPRYLELVLPKLSVGGLIVADNITFPEPDAGIREYVRVARSHPELQSQLIPIGSGLELSVRLQSASGGRFARAES